MVREPRASVRPQLPPVSCAAPSWGLPCRALGLFPSSEKLGSCYHGNRRFSGLALGSLFGALKSVRGLPPQALPVPSASPPPIQGLPR